MRVFFCDGERYSSRMNRFNKMSETNVHMGKKIYKASGEK